MTRIIDLTHPIFDQMPVFPGDPEVSFQITRYLTEGNYQVSRVTMGSHTGTHIDAPLHYLINQNPVDAIPLDQLIGWAEILVLPAKGKGSEIGVHDLEPFSNRIVKGARILIRTGWSKLFGTREFFNNFPGITIDAAKWLASRKIALLGIEQPSTHPIHHVETHRILLAGHINLIESLANLESLTRDRVYLVILPMKLAGTDGAPVRAIAIEETPEENQAPFMAQYITLTKENPQK
ncbi:MAG: cyclase family protein [Armatimonadota bacterium]